MTSRHDESSYSSMSSLSAGLSAYNAAEPKPLTSASNSVRTPAPPPPRGGKNNGSVSGGSYKTAPHPSASSQGGNATVSPGGSGGRSRATAPPQQSFNTSDHHNNMYSSNGHNNDDDRSSATTRLVGLVNELTGSDPNLSRSGSRSRRGSNSGSGGGGGDNLPYDYYDEHTGAGGYYTDNNVDPRSNGDNRSIRSSSNTTNNPYGRSSSRGTAAQDNYDNNTRTSGMASKYNSSPLSSHGGNTTQGGGGSGSGRSVRSGGTSRSSRAGPPNEPDGMSHEFGADDPDGRQYAPGAAGGVGERYRAPSRGHVGSVGRMSTESSRLAREVKQGGGNNPEDDRSYYSNSRRGGGGGGSMKGSRSRYDDDDDDDDDDETEQDDSIVDHGSYYSRDSASRGTKSTVKTNKSGGRKDSQELVLARRGGDDDDSSAGTSSASTQPTLKKKKSTTQVSGADKNKRAMWWYNFSKCVTCLIPDTCIRKEDAEAKQAWREKVAICFCVAFASLFFVGIFGFVPVLLCQERTVYTLADVQERTDENWITLKGNVYDVTGLFERHPTGPAGIEAFLHDDASRLFPRLPPAALPAYCTNPSKIAATESLQTKTPICSDFTEEDIKNGLPCHNFVAGRNATLKFMGEFHQGQQAHDEAALIDSAFTFWVSIHDKVYNVTDYINSIRNEQTKQIEKDHPLAYLEQKLNNLVINKLNEDATELFVSLFPDNQLLGCMDELFFVGIIDTRFDVVCFVLNIFMYFLLTFVATIMVAQMFCSLMYIAKGTRTYTDEDTQDQVIIMVPCYNEGGEELIKTIDSVLATTYPEENKVIFIIADGVVTGAGQELSTPEHLAEILGFEMDAHNDELYEYDSIGLLTTNRARVYHGYYEVEDRSLKYLVVVKHGLPMEQTGSAKPGNRGKRDSQLVIMGYFNRVYHGRELTELDAAIEDALIDLNMQSDDMRLLMTIDADTRVDELSITHMTYAMNQNDRILALCGETKVDNKWQSWVTMMQVFEYYNNHHMKKAFESAFGCVTCLPGCFTMYRILNDDGKPLLADDHVYAEYLRNDIDSLHEQNLFHLGEDRMLTTLLLHFFSGMFLSYVPEAQCFTIVPHSMKILLSQRRRWINSTYHNLLELTKVKTMCGVCCCSMKTVVYLDLIACMILPASTIYAVYLIFLVAAGKTKFSLLLLVLYGLIIGVQIIVFVLRSRYDFLFWFLYFTIIGVPVFYVVLPLYAFWHMDDFSWGETRKVAAMKSSYEKPPPPVEDDDDDSTSSSDDESEDSRSKKGSRRTVR